jgi:hypothetical protein
MTRKLARGWRLATALSLALPGCINELVVDVQQRPGDEAGVVAPDGGDAPIDEEDATTPGTPVTDAGHGPVPVFDAGPVIDVGRPDARVVVDAAQDSGSVAPEAAVDSGGPIIVEVWPTDAGDPSDASCKAASCDAGAPAGPCASCGGAPSFVRQQCGNSAKDTCWTNPDGTCTIQCPPVTPCSSGGAGCGSDEYCYFPENDCGKSGGGYCAKRPTCSSPIQLTVCGCNGMEYKNGCMANQAGTAIASYTMCK